MPSDTTALLRSIRRWVVAAVFLLGVGVVTLADTGYVVSGYRDGPIFAAAGVAGGAVALVAGARLLGSLTSRAVDDGRPAE